ncbi:protein-disulfide reductase DsbD [Actimicrobium sp. CCC2.4]|uniref:protein-disulfide reductase DsbD n=1 Tax=Actimicrobium sp. CCC2.4 TaxID=3048606 RepID=UPI002AC8FB3C|nr:protein-disulfide reductase DsbD [Actimicrobium sp. CCC2.4]MEB0135453.1 protein-disulfide reductase DsbD [Actimicrobium sp. CCC2.4]WPX32373.1 protein-disulfide reductase DsbD [Actimicrobium sp. CCC2.4]
MTSFFVRFGTRDVLSFLCALLLFSSPYLANAAQDYLEPEKAFNFSAQVTAPDMITITYKIADGYYMYRDHFRFKASGASLGEAIFPPGKVKFDETFQKDVETFRNTLKFQIPVVSNNEFELVVTSQGCADAGLCYAPMDNTIKLTPDASLAGVGKTAGEVPSGAGDVIAIRSTQTETGRIESALLSGRFLLILPIFFLLGLGLSLTPCVLPMVPILSSIIVGDQKNVSRGRGFLLAMTYSLGMALVYTLLGIAAGLIGEGLSATLQNPWVLTLFALLMVGFSLSMFNVYQLQMPPVVQQQLIRVSGNHTSGKLLGVFLMGAISALIVGPCVAAPLAGALVYISQSRDVLVGGSALFAMAIGMSVPLLLLGLSAGVLLPRAGAWMEDVKKFFGVLMLGVALWMVSSFLPVLLQMAGWCAIGIGYGSYLLSEKLSGWIAKSIGIVFIALGLIQLIGVASGGRDALAPLDHLRGEQTSSLHFERIKSVTELDNLLQKYKNKTVMLDFYADWCVSCKEMERLTFTDPLIRSQLAAMILLQVDVTKNTDEDKELLKRFKLFGPPGIIFFRDQLEVTGTRVIGYQNAKQFNTSLDAVVVK